MKKFSGEFVHSYQTYSFGYANYAELEKGDLLSDMYALGYLPYSGSPDAKNIFYMARSARIPLSSWEEASENRRIGKRFDGKLSRIEHLIADFDFEDKKFLDFCLAYFTERHGKEVMPEERLLFILKSGIVTHIVEYREGEALLGYVLEARDEKMTHFWFSFYDLAHMRQSLGLWLMLDCLREAKKQGKKYFYVGTVYGEKALYKSNFEPLEFWNGEKWMKNGRTLKELARKDALKSIPIGDAKKEDWKKF